MSDTWYREPFELPPYADGFGRVWSFDGQQVSGAPELEPQWPEDWPEDLRYLLFQAEVSFLFAERYRGELDKLIDQWVGRLDGPGPKGFLTPPGDGL